MQLTDLDRRRAFVLLPLVGGLLAVGVAQLSPPAVVIPLSVGTLVGLGAVVPERPWRTAAIFEAPGLTAAMARAAGDSLGLVAVVLAMSPVVLAISWGLVRAGAALRRERDARRGEEGASDTAERVRGDRGLFATKARRGAFLIVLLTVLGTCNAALTQRWGDTADRLARQRAEEIRSALAGREPQSLQNDALRGAYGGAREPLPGGPYREMQPGATEFTASAEVRSGLEYRCIRVRVHADATVHTSSRTVSAEQRDVAVSTLPCGGTLVVLFASARRAHAHRTADLR